MCYNGHQIDCSYFLILWPSAREGQMAVYDQVELLKFVDKYIGDLLDWALLVFFHSNPGTTDRAVDIAVRLGRKETDVRKAVERFSAKNLLKKIESEEDPVYVFEPPDKLKNQIDRFMEAISTPDLRVNLLSRVFEKKGAV